MKHTQHRCPGIGKPGCMSNGEVDCMVCQGGLALCTVCGAAEGEQPTECPGRRMLEVEFQAVREGLLDFKNGAWVKP